MGQGIFGFGATFEADLNLSTQIAFGCFLLAGMMLARAGKYRAHQICQTTVVLSNLVLIGGIMIPSFHRQVCPHLGELKDPYYLLPTVHALLGGTAELLGLYILLSAGTKLLPERCRIQKYKPWMRTTLVIWWLTIFLGIGTYHRWYVSPTAQAAPAAATTTSVIKMSNFQFEPKELTVTVGTKVQWTDMGGRHNIKFDDGSVSSPDLVAGGTYEHTFDKPGTFPYYCGNHGQKGGKLMSGVVTVTAK